MDDLTELEAEICRAAEANREPPLEVIKRWLMLRFGMPKAPEVARL